MHYYSTVDQIILTHSDLIIGEDLDYVKVRFERPNETGFDFAEGKLPHFTFQKSFGFSEDEIFQLIRYLKNNSALIWEFSMKGGAVNA